MKARTHVVSEGVRQAEANARAQTLETIASLTPCRCICHEDGHDCCITCYQHHPEDALPEPTDWRLGYDTPLGSDDR